MPGKETVITVSGLTKSYGSLIAVDHIDFEVKKGEIFGFLGPNGAGKTTTQRVLTGIIPPTSGKVSVLGYDIKTEAFYAKSQIGVVPEVANVYVDLSAWDNLMLIGSLYGVAKQEKIKRAKELLNAFDLYGRRDVKTKSFSKGMKQRLLLCMGLIHSPRLVFLDEPTSGLDVASSRLIREMILKFNKEGVTIFLTTHNIKEADELCGRIAIINHGTIAAVDNPENLKKKFQSSQIIEVVFNAPVKDESLREISQVHKLQRTGDKFKLWTDNPERLITELLDFSREKNVKITNLNTLGPDLEEVFLKITEEYRG